MQRLLTLLLTFCAIATSVWAQNAPVLVVGAPSNPFSSYYTQILRTEGFVSSDYANLSTVTSTVLNGRDLVILGETPLTTTQVNMFVTWVNGGGKLIAMRPDKQLAGLLGLTVTSSTLSDGYFKIDTTRAPGLGSPNVTMQFHGSADLYGASGATVLATLYSNSSSVTASPAVTLRNVGSSGGQAAAFSFDMAKSIVYTRQGNPAWAGTERDGTAPIRSNDMFFGPAVSDPKPDWVDRSKIAIPQADELQRFFANLVLQMNLSKKPLPRFWYFPFGKKAAIVMTGDDHANGGTIGRFDAFNAASPAGCVVANWECIRGTSYIFSDTPITPAQALAYQNQGHEVALHVNTGCADFNSGSIATIFSEQLATFNSIFPSLTNPVTNRTHCIAFSDWSSQVKTSLANGIRLDTNYYYWPASWVLDTPGFMTGSGMPQRFADLDGTTLDVYQAESQMTDESGQTYPMTGNVLLDRALGPEGYYGFFVANIHTDSATNQTQTWAMDLVNSAKARGVPVITASQLLRWTDARNNSTVTSLAYSGNTLTFTLGAASNSTGLQMMLPFGSATGTVASITRSGNSVPYTMQVIKGITYVVFNATSGNYSVSYSAPAVTINAVPATVNLSANQNQNLTATVTGAANTSVTWSMNPAVGTLVVTGPNTARYDAPSIIVAGTAIEITATSNADPSKTDVSTIVLQSSGSSSIGDTTVSDFGSGTLSGIYIAESGDGEILVQPAVATEFSGTSIPQDWTSTVWTSGGTSTVAGGVVTVDGTRLSANATYAAGSTVEFAATFSADSFQHVGLSVDLSGAPWAMFSTNGGGSLWARTNNGSQVSDTNLGAALLNAPHVFRIQWGASTVTYFVDDVQVASHAIAISTPMRPVISDYNSGGGAAVVNWLRMPPYAASASFLSRILDAGSTANWGIVNWGADVPAGTSLTVRIRTGNTPSPDGSWTNFASVSNGGTLSGSSRYLQYEASFATNGTGSPTLRDLSVATGTQSGPQAPTISGVTAVAQTNGSSVVINWNTNVASTSRIDVGTSASALSLIAVDNTPVLAHSLVMTGLAPSTTYYYRVTSAVGTSTTVSPNPPANPSTFLTLNAPPVISALNVSAGITSVTVTWTTNIASNTRVEYGTSPTALTSTAQNGTMLTNHSIVLSGLTANTTYYYRVRSTETTGATGSSPAEPANPATFSTIDNVAPVVTGLAAYPAPSGRAEIRWVTSKPTTSRVNYGTSSSNLNLNVSDSVLVVNHAKQLTGLTQGTRYYYRVVSADALGNTTTYPPTTEAPASFVENSVSFWNATANPTKDSDSDSFGIELGMKFTSSSAGSVTGVMFYKGAGNDGTHVGSLWTADGTQLATVTFENETSSGWQRAMFSNPVAISANTVYVISYHAPQGHYASDPGYFNTPVVATPLQTVADGANGLYRVTDGPAFPMSSVASTNYWVDVIFVDNVAPTVSNISVVPAGTSATVTWTTNEPATAQIQYGTSSSNLSLSASSSTLATTRTINLTGLNANTTYYYRLVSTDAAGNVLTQPASPAAPSSFGSGATIPVTITGVSSVVGSNTAIITWTTNLPSNSRVDYGTSQSSLSQNTTDATLVTAHSITLSNLNASTRYYFRVQSTVTSGNSATSPASPASPATFLTSSGSGGASGNPPEEWDITGAGDASIQGYTTDISYNLGQTVQFKIDTDATAYTIDIYRLGYYQGNGALKITTVNPSVSLPQNQPNCLTEPSTGLIDCGNWAVSASWPIPTNAKSGIYIAKLTRSDTGGASHVAFIVRDDASTSDIVFQASDTTWQAYNTYGGNSLYVGNPVGRAYKVSYNRPFITRDGNTSVDWLFNAEYPMIRWLEANGYNVTYIAGVDTDRRGNLLTNHKVFMSVGHDEYWSGAQRANVEAARAAGVNLAFFSGNEVFWKVRYENSISTPATSYRTMVSYKETHADAKIDPTATWTGTWRDPRFSPPSDGGRPENALTGTIFTVNCCSTQEELDRTIIVPAEEGKHRFWRNTSVANLAAGQSATLTAGLLGYEWDEDLDNGFRPSGLMRLSSGTFSVPSYIQDYGSTYAPGSANHALTLYRHSSGALVFGAGTAQWSWGLDGEHDRGTSTPDVRVRQATVNLLADMGVQPTTIQSGLVPATKSTDVTRPVTAFTSPTNGASVAAATAITLVGTASDVGGSVSAVEVSVDGGLTWKRANGRANWTFSWSQPAAGPATLMSRAIDDSGNVQNPATSITVTVVGPGSGCNPCSIWPTGTPSIVADPDSGAIEVGVKFRTSVAGQVTGIRFYKGATNTGTHVGTLWTASGTSLGSVIFTNETASGWQEATLAAPINLTPNTTYVVSYFAPAGRYSADSNYFATQSVNYGPLTALKDGLDGNNGLFRYGSAGFPTSSYQSTNYWVDVIFVPGGLPNDTTPPVISSVSATANTNGATVTWTTNEAATTRVDYGTSASALNSSFLVTALTTPHTANLTGLAGATTYFYRVYSADASGNLAVSPAPPTAPLTFTTGTPVVTCNPCSVWPTGTPSVAAAADGGALELGVKFRTSVPGQIAGIRFYKGVGNVGTHIGNLWDAAGTPLASATFTNETDSGWQQVVFNAPVTVTPNTTYVASYFAPNGRYSTDANYFVSAPTTQGPLTALQNGTDGPNGLFQYNATSIFPASSYQSTNYWVDVLFIPAIGPTISGLTVTPSQSSAAVQWTTNVAATARVDYGTSPTNLNLNVSSASLTTNRTLTLTGLSGATTYYYRVSSTNAAGNTTYSPIVTGAPLSFVTQDQTLPIISGVSATPGATGATVVWTTNEPTRSRVDYGTSASNLNLNVSSATFTTSAALTLSGLTPATTYFYRVTATDAAGNVAVFPVAPAAPLSFTTTATSSGCNPCSLWPSGTPAIVDSGDPGAVEVGMKFRSSVNGQVTGMRFYKAPANTGTHIGHIFTPAGANLGTVTFADETSSGWQTATFSSPISVTAGTTYIVAYHAPSGHYSVDLDYLTGSAYSAAPLTALQDGFDGGNGLYGYGAPGLPSSSYRGSNYWVDVIFVPSGGVDSDPPAISSVTATPTQNSATIQWVTSEPATTRVDYGTSASTLNLTSNSSTLSVTHSASIANLIPGTYYYRVTSVDAAGNTSVFPAAPAAPLSFTTTSAPVTCNPCMLWPTATPATIDSLDTGAIEVGVKFRVSETGQAKGIRFYKSAANAGPHVGTLWSSNGTPMATVNFTSESASGWQAAVFSSPVTLQPNNTYVVSYFSPSGHYSVSTGYFTSQSVTNGPLTALQAGLDGGNGVFLYGASGFPTSTFQGANYWVDVIFAPSSVPDTTAPSVTSSSVTPSETAATLQILVDEPATAVLNYGTSAANLNQTLSSPGITMSPAFQFTGLTPGATYYYRVTLTDTTGNVSVTPAAPAAPSSFTTLDTVAPVVSSVTATPGETTTTIQWTTDEPATSVVNYGTSAASLNLSVNSPTLATSRTMTLTGLTASTIYYYRVTSVDAAGNSVVFPALSSAPLQFTTVDLTPPVNSSVTATPASNGTSATIQWTTNEPARGRVDYGLSAGSLTLNVNSSTLATSQSFVLPGLQEGATYYYRVTSTDAAGNATTTPAAPNAPSTFATPDVTAPTVSGLTAVPGTTTAAITWSTNEPANSRVNYGTSASNLNLNASSATFVNGSRTVNLSGLTSGVTYFYRVVSVDQAGNTTTFPIVSNPASSFTTLDTTPPVVSNVQTSNLTRNSVRISWTTNEASNSRVNYGTSSGSLTSNVTDAAMLTSHSINLTGLTAGTQYYYKVVSADPSGNSTTAPSSTVSFTTPTSDASPTGTTIQVGTLNSGTFADLATDNSQRYQVNSSTSGTRTVDYYATFSNIPKTGTNFTVTYNGGVSLSCTQQLYIYNFTNSTWATLGGTQSLTLLSETTVTQSPSGNDSDYVQGSGPTGNVRVRVVCTSGSSFTLRSDLMRLTY